MTTDPNRYDHMGGNWIVMFPLSHQGSVPTHDATQVMIAISFLSPQWSIL